MARLSRRRVAHEYEETGSLKLGDQGAHACVHVSRHVGLKNGWAPALAGAVNTKS
ncbi:hypothetical protein ACFYXW_12345 [Streptomyces sp. NPDC001981]|uniref:hypothetical protein n=1 Tax=Streptomyces sp. NPDC001981 TaxID=3364628 RepID=UPI00369FFAF4